MHVKNEQLNTINNLNEIKIKLQYQVKKHLGDFTNKPKKKKPHHIWFRSHNLF